MTETPVPLDFDHFLCAMHGEPFRKQWPFGYPTLATIGLEIILEKEEVQKKCKGDPAKLPRVLKRKPVCCRLSKSELFGLYLQSGIGKYAPCPVCEKVNKGEQYIMRYPTGKVMHFPHVCFECVITKVKSWSPGNN